MKTKKCIDCGKLITPIDRVIRCKSCNMKIRNIPLKKSPEEKKQTARRYFQRRYQSKKKLCPICKINFVSPRAGKCQKCMGKNLSSNMQMEKSRFWKNGKHIHNGYVMICIGNGKYISEHRLVWEKINNSKLPHGWHIHHLNGIKNDNNPNNLVALSSYEHKLVLKAKAKRIQELEKLLII